MADVLKYAVQQITADRFQIIKMVSLHGDINDILQILPTAPHFPQEITNKAFLLQQLSMQQVFRDGLRCFFLAHPVQVTQEMQLTGNKIKTVLKHTSTWAFQR